MSWVLALGVASVVSAQIGPPTSIQPGKAVPGASMRSESEIRKTQLAGPPILGYVVDSGGQQLESIAGKSNAPKIGDSVLLPDNTKRVYLPPRQLFALVEKDTGEAMQVWTLSAAGTMAEAGRDISGVMAHPDLVVFSPRGSAAVLYSQANASVQVIANLPAQPVVKRQVSISGAGMPSAMAVSDDGNFLAAAFADGRMLSASDGGAWNSLPMSVTPNAWAFVPNTHDLVISDVTRKMIVLSRECSADFRVLQQNVAADRLAFTKGGEELLAGSSTARQLWAIDLKSGNATPAQAAAQLDLLTPLRDGFTFLLATSPAVSVLRFNASFSN